MRVVEPLRERLDGVAVMVGGLERASLADESGQSALDVLGGQIDQAG
jgi:hypothetical protein